MGEGEIRGLALPVPYVVQYGDSRQARHPHPRAMTKPITVLYTPGTTRENNIAVAHKLAAVGIESHVGWVDTGATYGLPEGSQTGDSLFAELFG